MKNAFYRINFFLTLYSLYLITKKRKQFNLKILVLWNGDGVCRHAYLLGQCIHCKHTKI